ncbi:hypothetical protein KI688_002326 [Linnemannia hyalina]|uniref:Uncharacterized protein n=1 Tax=Linnemannia hyalina TaxID=64524 RepID=A0A9P8BTI8_9FUNG|nr:hypothetical protein KI688_002326 [Linnemannia hyalina]
MGELREFILDTKMPQNISNLDQRQQQNQSQEQLQYWTRRYPNRPPSNINTLEMTLRSGLAALETLIKLTELSV